MSSQESLLQSLDASLTEQIELLISYRQLLKEFGISSEQSARLKEEVTQLIETTIDLEVSVNWKRSVNASVSFIYEQLLNQLESSFKEFTEDSSSAFSSSPLDVIQIAGIFTKELSNLSCGDLCLNSATSLHQRESSIQASINAFFVKARTPHTAPAPSSSTSLSQSSLQLLTSEQPQVNSSNNDNSFIGERENSNTGISPDSSSFITSKHTRSKSVSSQRESTQGSSTDKHNESAFLRKIKSIFKREESGGGSSGGVKASQVNFDGVSNDFYYDPVKKIYVFAGREENLVIDEPPPLLTNATAAGSVAEDKGTSAAGGGVSTELVASTAAALPTDGNSYRAQRNRNLKIKENLKQKTQATSQVQQSFVPAEIVEKQESVETGRHVVNKEPTPLTSGPQRLEHFYSKPQLEEKLAQLVSLNLGKNIIDVTSLSEFERHAETKLREISLGIAEKIRQKESESSEHQQHLQTLLESQISDNRKEFVRLIEDTIVNSREKSIVLSQQDESGLLIVIEQQREKISGLQRELIHKQYEHSQAHSKQLITVKEFVERIQTLEKKVGVSAALEKKYRKLNTAIENGREIETNSEQLSRSIIERRLGEVREVNLKFAEQIEEFHALTKVLHNDITQKNRAIHELQVQNAGLQGISYRNEEKIQEVKRVLAGKEKNLKLMQEKERQLAEEVARIERERQTLLLTVDLNAREMEAKQRAVQKKEQEINEKDAFIEDLTARNDNLQQLETNLNEEIFNVLSEADNAKAEAEAKIQDLNQVTKEWATIFNFFLKHLLDADSAREEARNELQAARDTIEQLQQECDRLLAELEESSQTKYELEKLASDLNQFFKDISSLSVDLNARLTDPAMEVAESNVRLSALAEWLEGEQARWETEKNSFLGEVLHLKEENRELASCLSEAEGKHSEVLGRMQEAQAERLKIEEKLTAISSEKHQLQNEIEDMKIMKENLENDIQMIDNERDGLKLRISEVETDKTALEERITCLEKDNLSLTAKLSEEQNERSKMNDELEAQEINAENDKEYLIQLQAESDQLAELNSQLMAEKDQLNELHAQTTAQLEELTVKLSQVNEIHESTIQQLNNELVSTKIDNENLHIQLIKQSSHIEELLLQIESSKGIIEEKSLTISTINEQLAESKLAVSSLTQSLNEQAIQSSKLIQELSAAGEENNGLKEELSTAREVSDGQRLELSTARKDNDGLREELSAARENDGQREEVSENAILEKDGLIEYQQEELKRLEEKLLASQQIEEATILEKDRMIEVLKDSLNRVQTDCLRLQEQLRETHLLLASERDNKDTIDSLSLALQATQQDAMTTQKKLEELLQINKDKEQLALSESHQREGKLMEQIRKQQEEIDDLREKESKQMDEFANKMLDLDSQNEEQKEQYQLMAQMNLRSFEEMSEKFVQQDSENRCRIDELESELKWYRQMQEEEGAYHQTSKPQTHLIEEAEELVRKYKERLDHTEVSVLQLKSKVDLVDSTNANLRANLATITAELAKQQSEVHKLNNELEAQKKDYEEQIDSIIDEKRHLKISHDSLLEKMNESESFTQMTTLENQVITLTVEIARLMEGKGHNKDVKEGTQIKKGEVEPASSNDSNALQRIDLRQEEPVETASAVQLLDGKQSTLDAIGQATPVATALVPTPKVNASTKGRLFSTLAGIFLTEKDRAVLDHK